MEKVLKAMRPAPDSDMALKPCPFCGSDEVIYMKYQHDAGERWKVFCCGCAAGIDPGWAQTRGAVKDMWNKRVNERPDGRP